MEGKSLHKQVFLYALINYLGVGIGIVSALFIYPKDFEFLGTVKFIDNVAQLLFPIMVLGASHALIKFYPVLNEKMQRQLFNYSIVSICCISVVLLAGIVVFTWVTHFESSTLVYFAFPVAVSLAFIELFRKQAQDLKKLAVPTLFEKIIPKVALPALFLLLIGGVLEVYASLTVYVITYIVIFLLTGFYVYKYFKPGFSYRFKPLFNEISRKDYFRYSLYSFAGSLGSLLAFRVDGIFIHELISSEANGIFSNGVTLASVLQIPAVGLFALYAPIISAYIKEENFSTLQVKYRETAKFLFFLGAVLFSCIALGISDLFSLLPAKEELLKTVPVILVLGLSVLINMATGFNTEIISYSRYYRFNMIAILSLVVVNIALNLFFIYTTDMGIVGVSIASFISMVLFNIAKLLFIYKKFGLLPFDAGSVKLALIFIVSGTAVYLLPASDNTMITLVYKTGLSLIINVVVVYRLRLVHELNTRLDALLKR